MMSHGALTMPTPLSLFFAALSLCACTGHDTVWDPEPGVVVGRGQSVAPWESPQEPAWTDGGGEPDAAPQGATDEGDDAGVLEAGGAGVGCTFAVTTLPLGGRYSPKNVGAIWIEDEQGAWVRTLAVWAGVRARYLTALRAADPTRSRVDAVTSATLRQHERHVVFWDLTDESGSEVADGAYVLRAEVTERDGPGPTMSAMFVKSTRPFSSEPSDSDDFVDVELRCE